MFAKCNKCGYITPYDVEHIKDELSEICQLDIFGQSEPILVGIVQCNHCGEKLAVKSKKDTIKDNLI